MSTGHEVTEGTFNTTFIPPFELEKQIGGFPMHSNFQAMNVLRTHPLCRFLSDEQLLKVSLL